MNSDAALRRLAQTHGVHLEYHDLTGARRQTPPPTLRALLAALGIDATNDAAVAGALAAAKAEDAARHLPAEIILPADLTATLPVAVACEWTLLDEDLRALHGGKAPVALTLPPLRVGFYQLQLSGPGWRENSLVMATPARAPELARPREHRRNWGITGALYALRSGHNGGLGNYRDLATAAETFGKRGAQFFGINPISALGWGAEDVISPYSPTHRGFFNADHIAVEGGLGPSAANALIDYPAFRARHRPALEAAFKAQTPDATYRSFCKAAGPALNQFACFEALSERHGPDFRTWPENLRVPGKPATQRAGRRADFHRWLQYRAEAQIDAAHQSAKDAGMSLGLYLDLAVGARPGGAEAWMHADTLAHGVTIGAPPDQLSPEGQSWNLVAHAPSRLAAAHYAPLRHMLRRLMRKCGLIRIDHALGLMRSFWLPDAGGPGAYITQPFDSLLAVVAIEAHLAGCVVVGEDLGLVPPGFRERMNAAGLYSYAVWQYEAFDDGWLRAPGDLRPFSLACFATHDTPTLRGFWYGTDVALWQKMGWLSSGAAAQRHAARAHQRASLRRHGAIGAMDGSRHVTDAIHGALAASPAAMIAVQLDDIFGQIDAPNLPGTVDQHPNWRRRCPVAIEDFDSSEALTSTVRTMAANGSELHVPAEKGLIGCPE